MMIRPEARAIERLVLIALEEDAPWGDVTSQAFIPPEAGMHAQLVAREAGVLCGEDVFTAAMGLTDTAIVVEFAVHDGAHFREGTILATVQGSARGILRAERIGLNFVQRLSGIATLTAKYVAAAAGTKARIVDTRKTTPGLRILERYAVRCGGGQNHRSSLSDAALLKDNHLAILSRESTRGLAAAMMEGRSRLPHTTHLEVEVDGLEQIDAVLEAGVDTILLDNFTSDELRMAVTQIAGRSLVEASGGVTLERVGEIASTGVDLISVGALTHSVRCLDIGLDLPQ
jgi:nicotinate-nucleotide pyrophosphorylase (carboxylating)